jgi:hypothetical protein
LCPGVLAIRFGRILSPSGGARAFSSRLGDNGVVGGDLGRRVV